MKQDTLNKIEADIANNDYGKARTRFHSLIAQYPNDLQLRKMLGDVYHQIDYPEMAGRYWFLESIKTPEMQTACDFFSNTVKTNRELLQKLKFRGNINDLNDLYAANLLRELYEETGIQQPSYKNRTKDTVPLTKERDIKGKLITYGCAAIIGFTMLFALIGFFGLIVYLTKR